MRPAGFVLFLLNLAYAALILIDTLATQRLPFRSGDDAFIPWLVFVSIVLIPVLTGWYIFSSRDRQGSGPRVLRVGRLWLDAKERELQERAAGQSHPPAPGTAPAAPPRRGAQR